MLHIGDKIKVNRDFMELYPKTAGRNPFGIIKAVERDPAWYCVIFQNKVLWVNPNDLTPWYRFKSLF